jgi:Ala-tRNA(Pro) deacylase
MNQDKEVFSALDKLNIAYEVFEHPAVFGKNSETEDFRNIPAVITKNLFLTNKKRGKYYLIITKTIKDVDLKVLKKVLLEPKLRFANSEELYEHLKLTPGSVSSMGLINDSGHSVIVVLDQSLLTASKIGMHPNRNTATIVISKDDFLSFIRSTGNKLLEVQVISY